MLQTKRHASGIIDTVGLDHPSLWNKPWSWGHRTWSSLFGAIGNGHQLAKYIKIYQVFSNANLEVQPGFAGFSGTVDLPCDAMNLFCC